MLVELAQNAADAAVRGGLDGRGRLLLRLVGTSDGAVLLAAGDGAPLDAAGTRALAGLRASTKRVEPGEGVDPVPEGVVGRFGVGFTAVLAVTDAPALVTATGGVGFDRARVAPLLADAAAGDPTGALADEVRRRAGSLPVLRTPAPVDAGSVPASADVRALLADGWSTVVVLPLRPDAVAAARRQLDDVDDLLLLSLPALSEVRVERPDVPPRVVRDVAERWHVLRRSGSHEAAALAGRPAEEQASRRWALAWALPRRAPEPVDAWAAALGAVAGGAVAGPGVVFAPTPTDEPLPWAAVLVATLPLEPTRRHVEPGPATDAVLHAAAAAYADLLGERAADDAAGPAGPDVLDLVPVGPVGGWLDAALRRALDDVLPDVPLLRPAGGSPLLLAGRRALALEEGGTEPDAAALGALAVAEPALVAAPRRHRAALETLGVGRLPLADLVDGWPLPRPGDDLADPLGDEPSGGAGGLAGWRALAAALAPLALDQRAREALAGLPVPLVGGRWVRGCRGALLGGPAADALVAAPDDGDGARDAVATLLAEHGLRLVDPAAADDPAAAALLERLGAVPAGAAALLDDPATGVAVRAVADALVDDELDDLVAGLAAGADADDVVDALADVVLGWLAADGDDRDRDAAPVGVVPGRRSWLLDLPLRDVDDELAPAGSLVLPGSRAEEVLDPDEVVPVADELVARWSAAVLVAAGVTASASVLHWPAVDLDDPPEELADAAGSWLDDVADRTGEAGGWEVEEVALVRDLDLVRGGGGRADRVVGQVAAALDAPAARDVLTAEVRLRGPAGETLVVPSPTASLLRRAVLDVDAGPVAADDADVHLRALLPPAGGPTSRGALPPAWAAAAGVVRAWSELDARTWPSLLQGSAALAVPGAGGSAEAWLVAWRHLAAWAATAPDVADARWTGDLVGLGDGVSTRDGPGGAVLVDDPFAVAHPACATSVVVPRGSAATVAGLLGLETVADRLDPDAVDPHVVVDGGREVDVPAAVRAVLRLAGGADAGTVRLRLHDRLVVAGEVVDAWVVDGDGPEPAAPVAHGTDARSAGRALAWAAGAWGARSAVVELLVEAGLPAGSRPAPGWRALVDAAFDA
ncbi:sacsin N-terminal ATP-binding-like domain-containing protein [Pseudokineococcus lusitanus]|uniref:sacsin N-terminal ATP-binding-like domain-containing protein n=1 Tax=Pseudokineococcus lusitanus TaxID=763993 RepID=UPI000F491528|nr:ATP-binding protein [Pseudokineococcus lusitanus]